LDQPGQRVVQVEGEDECAVDVSAGQVARDARVVVAALGEQQDELVVLGRQLLADPPELQGEEGVGEDPALRFGDDDRDRVVPLGDETSGGLVGHVTEFLDGPAHPFDERLPDPVAAVHHPGHRGPGDPGPGGHGLQSGTWRGIVHIGLLVGGVPIRIAPREDSVESALVERRVRGGGAGGGRADRG